MELDLEELTGLKGGDPMHATIQGLLNDPATSFWFRDTLLGALRRDPVQALNEAEVLYSLLHARAEAITKQNGGLGRL